MRVRGDPEEETLIAIVAGSVIIAVKNELWCDHPVQGDSEAAGSDPTIMIEPEARSMVFWSSWDIATVTGKVGKNPKRRSEGNEKTPPAAGTSTGRGLRGQGQRGMNSLRP